MTQDVRKIQKMQNQAWELQRAGEYPKAIKLYSECYEASKNPNYLYQRGMAYLEAENYTAALQDMKSVVTLTDSRRMADGYFIYQGICLWCLGRYSQVLPIWEKGLDTPYTDASGGVVLPALMLYGAERLNDTHYQKLAIHLLHKNMKRKPNSWPWTIVPYLLGQIDEDVLSAAAATTSEILQSRWQCQIDFYIALHSLREDNWARFKASMSKCAENPYGYHEFEYFLAQWERNNEFPEFISKK